MEPVGTHAMSEAVRRAYRENEEDETLQPIVLIGKDGKPEGRINKGDAVIFYNIRGEREIELTRSLTEKGFSEFPTVPDLELAYATMIEYQRGLPVAVAFPPEDTVEDSLSALIARAGLGQIKITEAEKAVHVSYFLNGKRQEPFPGEERITVPTRKDVALFDAAPEMSIGEITAAIISALHDRRHSFIFANFPNVDVVGHIENKEAVIRAIEAVDRRAGEVIEEAVREGMTVIVSADHGTVEKWLYPDGAVDTGHTDSPVPFVVIATDRAKPLTLRKHGELADVAPTVLELLGIPPSPLMTGRSLIVKTPDNPCGAPLSPRGDLQPPAVPTGETVSSAGDITAGEATRGDGEGETSGPGRQKGPRVLYLLLDGWGYREEAYGNLLAAARTPVMDRLLAAHPFAVLEAAGEAVGLPPGTVGNSEAGHLHIGTGRRIYSDRVRIDRAVADGSFFRNGAFLQVMAAARERKTALHLMGIVSFFSSHGSLLHLFALLEMAKRQAVPEVYIHAMLGRRGEQPESGARYIAEVERKCAALGLGKVVSVIGRYWSMDREENWDRIAKTYRMLVGGEGRPVTG
ncbi:MAG TPA: alkaline phosphatase family protein [Syntrophales bacterium]|nr:alkaline phosphatase family protein [Syntrophales bacterium]